MRTRVSPLRNAPDERAPERNAKVLHDRLGERPVRIGGKDLESSVHPYSFSGTSVTGAAGSHRSCGDAGDECAIRHIVRHDRPGTRRGMVTDAHRRAQDGIGTDERMIADLCALLDRRPVVVRGDRPRADVDMRANRRVSEIGDMPDCRMRANRRLLDLDEVTDMRALADQRARPQVAERTAIRPSLHHGAFERRRDNAAPSAMLLDVIML